MTTYKRSERHYCRYWLRRVAWRVNLLLAVLALALVLVAQPAQAQTTVRCTWPAQPGFYRANGRTVGVCYVYRPAGVLP